MDDVSAKEDISVVIRCIEVLIDLLGEAFANVRAACAAEEQVCEDYREAIRFLRQLRVVEVSFLEEAFSLCITLPAMDLKIYRAF